MVHIAIDPMWQIGNPWQVAAERLGVNFYDNFDKPVQHEFHEPYSISGLEYWIKHEPYNDLGEGI